MIYLGLKDIDLTKFSFGKNNVWHCEDFGMNKMWDRQRKEIFKALDLYFNTNSAHKRGRYLPSRAFDYGDRELCRIR